MRQGRVVPDLVGTVEASAVRFERITIAEGLSQNAVYALAQDRRGFLWVGTQDGLNRYDGYAFTVFRNLVFDSTSISSSHVTALFEDRKGRMWVGTFDGGLNRFDRATSVFRRYVNGPARQITAIEQDSSGALWVGTDGEGLYRLSREAIENPEAPVTRFRHDASDPRSLGEGPVYDVLVDSRGRVWVAMRSGLYRFEPGDAAGQPAGFVRHRLEIEVPAGLDFAGPSALHEDRQGRLWVGSGSGLSTFDPATAAFTHYRHRYHDYRYGWGQITDLVETRSGNLWASSYAALMRFNPATGTFDYYQHDPLDLASMSSNSSTTLYQDRSDVLWVGTNGYGLNKYDPKSDRFRTFRLPRDHTTRVSGFSVYTLFEDDAGWVWINALVLYRWNRSTGELYSFEGDAERGELFGNASVWALAQDGADGIWAGTEEGLYRYVPSSGEYVQYTHDPSDPESLPEKIVFGLHRDPDGTLWVITRNYIGRLVDPATGRFENVRYTDRPAPLRWHFPSPVRDASGVFWIASRDGLVRFAPSTGEVQHYRHDAGRPESISSDDLRALCLDPREPDRILWVGTAGGGVNRFDMEAGTFRSFTERDGLANNVVYGILPDRSGHLWMSTNRGLSRFDPQTETFRNFDQADGLQSDEFNSGAFFKNRSGELFFGGIHGFNLFEPGASTSNPHVPEVVLTRISLANHPVAAGDSSNVLDRDISETNALRLGYDDDIITFEFAALDFSVPEKNRYAYRLVGFNSAWVESGTVRSATYTDLPPGDYTFQVRGSNNDGLWNEAGTSLALIIAPPWWRTWWAYGVYAVLLGWGVFAFDRYQRRRLVNRERQRSRLREAEIHAEAAVKQTDALRRLDAMKSQFFANVSHEFRTPLTLTIGPLEDLRTGLHGPLDDTVAEQVALALRNARRLLRLINELLDLSRLENGRMDLNRRRHDLGAFLRRVASTYGDLAERRRITFRSELPDEPVYVLFDPLQLEKVFSNLLSNALKFTPEGGTIRLSLREEAEGSRRSEAVVRLRDTGPGIPAGEIDRIFDRFHRGISAEVALQPGTGIGLALASEVTRLHGGTLQVESEEGFGSTFIVRLPVAVTGAAALGPEPAGNGESRAEGLPMAEESSDQPKGREGSDEETEEEDPGAAVRPTGNGQDLEVGASVAAGEDEADRTTVLVVEDNPDMRRYICSHLRDRYRVVEAADGREGLERARVALPDLVVSDVMMPKMDGRTLCRILKEDAELDYVPVILLTARASAEDRLRGLAGGADDYLVKPFNVRELQARIENLIASRQHLRERFSEERSVEEPASKEKKPAGIHAQPVEATSSADLFLERVRAAIEANLADEDFSVEALAGEVGLSRVHLYRQLRDLIGQSPSALIRTVRLERAAQLLDQEAGTVGEVAYGVGFKSVSHFSRSFRTHYGCPPSQYASRTSE